jgi:hypothetical protein
MKYYVDEMSLKRVVNDINDKCNKALLYCWEYLQGKLQEEIMIDSYDTWNLARSINYQLVKDWLVEVWSNLKYALVREYWRRPWKFPPMDAISSWSARKWIISWWVTTWYNNLHYTDKGIVFIIARAIATRWIEWKHTFEKVYNREKNNIKDLFLRKMKW